MHKRVEWKHRLRPKALRKQIVWDLAFPMSRGNVVDELYDRYPECHRRRDNPICVQQDRLEIAKIIETLDWNHPKFDHQMYDDIVRKACTRAIEQVFIRLVSSLSQHAELNRKILDDLSLPLEMSNSVLFEARAHLASVKALEKLLDPVLIFRRAIASMDDTVMPDAHQPVAGNVKPQADTLKNNVFDEKLTRMSDYVPAKQVYSSRTVHFKKTVENC